MTGASAARPRVPYVGVGCLVLHGDRILLMRRHRAHGAGSWSTPGGHLDFGETPEACAVREVREETGLTAIRPRVIGITNDLFPEEKHYVTIWVRAEVVRDGPLVPAEDEATELAWCPCDALPEPLFLSLHNLMHGHSRPPFPAELPRSLHREAPSR